MIDVLLLSGLLCDERLWAASVEDLAVRVHIPEMAEGNSIPAMADAILSRSPRRFAVAGFSLGSCVALEIFARAPGRVTRLALLSAAVHGPPDPVRQHYLRSIPAIESGGLSEYLQDAFPRYVAPHRAHDQALWEIFSGMGESLGSAVAVRQMQALLDYPGYGGDLGAIRCPVAVIGGAEDRRATPEVHAELSRQIHGAVLTLIQGAGHFTPLEKPEAVKKALRVWLSCPNG
ncbi:MAG TPA: alpha/beta hydrolase [Terriglobia bacterium]|nr:alpha/beta hydrolase [Terriglobia bacterium]